MLRCIFGSLKANLPLVIEIEFHSAKPILIWILYATVWKIANQVFVFHSNRVPLSCVSSSKLFHFSTNIHRGLIKLVRHVKIKTRQNFLCNFPFCRYDQIFEFWWNRFLLKLICYFRDIFYGTHKRSGTLVVTMDSNILTERTSCIWISLTAEKCIGIFNRYLSIKLILSKCSLLVSVLSSCQLSKSLAKI